MKQPIYKFRSGTKMVLPALALFLCGFIVLPPKTTDHCNCVVKSDLYRAKEKHEKHFEHYHLHAATITSKTILGWKKQYKNIKTQLKKSDERVKNTPEDSIYHFDGYIYSIASAEADCDIHFNCGTASSKQTVSLEIPTEYCALQNKVVEALKAKGFKLSGKNQKGVHIQAKGLGFYDGHHGKWELHPVYEMKMAN